MAVLRVNMASCSVSSYRQHHAEGWNEASEEEDGEGQSSQSGEEACQKAQPSRTGNGSQHQHWAPAMLQSCSINIANLC